jgi:hypothetical protein
VGAVMVLFLFVDDAHLVVAQMRAGFWSIPHSAIAS